MIHFMFTCVVVYLFVSFFGETVIKLALYLIAGGILMGLPYVGSLALYIQNREAGGVAAILATLWAGFLIYKWDKFKNGEERAKHKRMRASIEAAKRQGIAWDAKAWAAAETESLRAQNTFVKLT